MMKNQNVYFHFRHIQIVIFAVCLFKISDVLAQWGELDGEFSQKNHKIKIALLIEKVTVTGASIQNSLSCHFPFLSK